MSAEVLQSLSSSVGSMVQPQSWTAVTGNPPAQHIPDSLCLSCLSASTSSSGDLLGVKSRTGLDALLHVSKSHGSDLLLLLLNDGKSPLLFFRCWGGKRLLSPLFTSPKSFLLLPMLWLFG